MMMVISMELVLGYILKARCILFLIIIAGVQY